ncbi:MAG: type II toxin-antitoxin system VapC family toxin [Flavobacteriales bacterium]
MTKLLVDTNVLLDLLGKREPFDKESRQLFSLADRGMIELVVSSLSIVNTHYILNDVMKIKQSRSIIGKFKVLVSIHDLNDKIIELALNDNDFKDSEDGIQYYTALESKCDCIVTRNLKDFKKSALPVFSPEAYLTSYKS